MAHNFPFRVDQEFLEIPLHVSSSQLRVGSEIFIKWFLSLVENSNLLHHWELDIVLLDEITDLLLSLGLLGAKLIARIS